jgi:hypothetical protein
MKIRTVSVWLRIESGGALSWPWSWTVSFYNPRKFVTWCGLAPPSLILANAFLAWGPIIPETISLGQVKGLKVLYSTGQCSILALYRHHYYTKGCHTSLSNKQNTREFWQLNVFIQIVTATRPKVTVLHCRHTEFISKRATHEHPLRLVRQKKLCYMFNQETVKSITIISSITPLKKLTVLFHPHRPRLRQKCQPHELCPLYFLQ